MSKSSLSKRSVVWLIITGVLLTILGGVYWVGRSLFHEPTAQGVDSVIGELGGSRVLGVFAHPDDEQESRIPSRTALDRARSCELSSRGVFSSVLSRHRRYLRCRCWPAVRSGQRVPLSMSWRSVFPNARTSRRYLAWSCPEVSRLSVTDYIQALTTCLTRYRNPAGRMAKMQSIPRHPLDSGFFWTCTGGGLGKI